MVFSFRIDIDTRKGLIKGVPFLENLANEFNVNFSYYIPIGGESNLIELLKHRGNREKFSGKSIEKLNFLEKLRTAFLPKDLPIINEALLNNLKEEGNEVGVHGFKHRQWTRSFDSLNLDKVFRKIEERYFSLFEEKPSSFAAPGFITDERVLEKLDEYNYSCASDLQNDAPFIPENHSHVQVPITMRYNRTPFIEYNRLQGVSDNEMIDRFKRNLDEKFSSLYIHPGYEGIKERELLRTFMEIIEKKGIEVKTILELAESITDSRS